MKSILYFSIGVLFFISCTHPHVNPLAYQTDTHSRGKAKLLIEESFKRLFDTSIDTFEGQFPKADIIPEYLAEDDIIQGFYDNKAKTIVISRDLNATEIKFLKSKHVEVRSDKIAMDAITFIVNPANKDTLLTVQEVKDILIGKIKNWKGSGQKINVVFDKPNSANYNYLKNVCNMDSTNKQVFAVNSNEEVINYVKKNPNALGVIGLNWISDDDDFDVQDFLKGIKVVAVAKNAKSNYFQPYAGFIYTKEYPFTRDIWMINKGRRSGLNTGFVIYMKGETGQTIIQKASLVPANSPVRLIQFTAN
jgi:phosphate transport system substrate-binding protein